MHLKLAFTLASLAAVTGSSSVTAVYPSGSIISDHTLRLTIQFASPQKSRILSRLSLTNQDNTALTGAFLEQELWSPDRRELTILFDPGRLKTGLIRQKDLGAPLEGQSTVTLSFDGEVIKSWQVRRSRCHTIALSEWRIDSPHARATSPVNITFPEAIDSRALHLIAVIDSRGRRVEGKEGLAHFEQEWSFTPTEPWRSGTYRILVHPDLENPCGDQIGDTFEHSKQSAGPASRSRTFRVLGN